MNPDGSFPPAGSGATAASCCVVWRDAFSRATKALKGSRADWQPAVSRPPCLSRRPISARPLDRPDRPRNKALAVLPQFASLRRNVAARFATVGVGRLIWWAVRDHDVALTALSAALGTWRWLAPLHSTQALYTAVRAWALISWPSGRGVIVTAGVGAVVAYAVALMASLSSIRPASGRARPWA